MIPALIGAGVAIGSAIYSGVKSAKARKEQRKLADQYNAENNAWFNKNYYTDYLRQADVQSTLGALRDRMFRDNRNIAGQAAMNGGTHEAVLAARQAGSRNYADALSSIAGQATDYKRQTLNTYLGGRQTGMNMLMGMYNNDANNASQFGSNGFQAGAGLMQYSSWFDPAQQAARAEAKRKAKADTAHGNRLFEPY